MDKTYSYGPLKSNYFSQYEKMWIEGYCKEGKIELTESNLCTVLSSIRKIGSPKSISEKIEKLIFEAEKFSSYSKDMFIKSWNNILGFSMGIVKPNGIINENQREAMFNTNKWWLMEAPKIMSMEMQYSYFKSFVVECVSIDANAIDNIKTFNPTKNCSIIENAKKYFSYEKINKPHPQCRFKTDDIKKNEAALALIPDSDKLISMIAWTAETTKVLSMFKQN